jgi:hypothetical protein
MVMDSAHRAVRELIKAEGLLNDARKMLIQARLSLEEAGLSELADQLAPMVKVLYAATVHADGGNLEAWNLMAIALQVGGALVDDQHDPKGRKG